MEANLRFFAKVIRINDSSCWEWIGGCANGYGSFFFNGRHIKAHRFAYELFVGEIPPHLEIDHLCRNRRCVNPTHLEPVTRSENIRRGLLPDIGRQYQESKTHCPQGHPYNEANTYLRTDRKGVRHGIYPRYRG